MNYTIAGTVDAAVSLVQTAKDSYTLTGAENGYEAFTNSLGLTATLAGNGPWAVGLNLAAIANGTVGAFAKFLNGDLKARRISKRTEFRIEYSCK